MRTHRQRSIERLRRRLLARGSPRLLMSLVIAGTGAAGFLGSWLLLKAGLHTMWIRYSLAVLFAYLVFLALLGIWIALQRRRQRNTPDEGIDLWPDVLPVGSGGGGPGPGGSGFSSGGGSFGGGGAQASFGPATTTPSGGGSGPGVGGGGISLDLDELFVVLAVVAAILAAAAASVWLVVSAPALFAELLLDGILVGQLYRRLRRFDGRHWLETALRKTAVPFLVTGISLAIAGFAMQRFAPEARSIGEVWKTITA